MSQARSSGRLSLAVVLFLLASLALMVVACNGGAEETDTAPTPTETAPTETAAPATEAPAEPTAEPAPTEAAEERSTEAPEASPSAATDEGPEPMPTAVELVQASQVSLVPVASGFKRPLYLTHALDDRLFVVEQDGLVKIIAPGQSTPEAEPFLDITDRVGAASLEQGLLSIAFHPQYQENGRFFVNYTNFQGDTVVSEFQVDPADPNRADAESERIILTVDQPYGNHNGGLVKFGPDGYLYVGMGDGGSAADPLGNGQNPDTLLGALLRLDVDNTGADGLPYAIPADNPFVGIEGARPEVYAYGLRNPWRYSFDLETGDLFLADVGQNLWEEVNFQAAGEAAGANFGWNVMEASHCFSSDSCDPAGFVMPVAEYGHQEGSCSISGGYIYRGQDFPSLTGNYFFADYCSGIVWSLFGSQADGWQQQQLQRTGMIVSSFGEDWQGELYIIDYSKGDVYQLQP